MDLMNCPDCGELFVKNAVREKCEKCTKEEEQKYDTVYQFLRTRENRAATMDRVEEATGVEKVLMYKWIRKGRLQLAQFPNLGYPCDSCGIIIREGKLCQSCTDRIMRDLTIHETEEARKAEMNKRATYMSADRRN